MIWLKGWKYIITLLNIILNFSLIGCGPAQGYQVHCTKCTPGPGVHILSITVHCITWSIQVMQCTVIDNMQSGMGGYFRVWSLSAKWCQRQHKWNLYWFYIFATTCQCQHIWGEKNTGSIQIKAFSAWFKYYGHNMQNYIPNPSIRSKV